jgi:putative addiction module component (TIGR02574 family)
MGLQARAGKRPDGFASDRRVWYNKHMSPIPRKDILNLTIAERIELIGDIWDTMAEVPEGVPLTEAQRTELDRRLEAHHKDPTAGAPWPVVRDRIAKRK